MSAWMKTASISAAAGALMLLLAGCSSAGSSSAAGTWGPDDGPQLVLADDGKLSGTDGCNRLMGGWEQEGDTVSFGQVASTMMACEGVDTWLSGLATAVVSGAELRILDATGAEIGTLDRQ